MKHLEQVWIGSIQVLITGIIIIIIIIIILLPSFSSQWTSSLVGYRVQRGIEGVWRGDLFVLWSFFFFNRELG